MVIKKYLTDPPVLVSPGHGDTLYLYLAASEIAVSAALFKECEDEKLRPVFFISKSMTDAETRYTHLEQAALALRTTAQKLRPYFQAYPVVVLTDLPLRGTIHKPDLSSEWPDGQWSSANMGYSTSQGFPRRGKSWPISLQNSRSPTHARIVRAGGPSTLMGPPDNQDPTSDFS